MSDSKASPGQSGVKTEEKKQHFDDIYVAKNPVPFKERIIDALEYISDDNNRAVFDRLVLPWCQERTKAGKKSLEYVDLCSCFGNTTLAAVHGMSVEAIRENWKDEESCRQVKEPRRLEVRTTGIDISENALAYGREAGIFDTVIAADLNQPAPETREAVHAAMRSADIVISAASLVYLDLSAIRSLLKAFVDNPEEGRMLVNFLNPFALEKSDATKKLLLEHLDFIGSAAARHRRLSPMEQENYPGQDWALLEIWVLGRRSRS